MQNPFFFGEYALGLRDLNWERNTRLMLISILSVILSLMWIAGIITYIEGMETLGGCLLGISLGFTLLLFIVVIFHYFCEDNENEIDEDIENNENNENNEINEINENNELKEVIIEL